MCAASGPTPEIEEIGLQPLAEEMHLSMLRDCRRHEFYDQCLARRISEVRGKVLMPAWLPGQLVERFTISVELVGCSKPAHSLFHCSRQCTSMLASVIQHTYSKFSEDRIWLKFHLEAGAQASLPSQIFLQV